MKSAKVNAHEYCGAHTDAAGRRFYVVWSAEKQGFFWFFYPGILGPRDAALVPALSVMPHSGPFPTSLRAFEDAKS